MTRALAGPLTIAVALLVASCGASAGSAPTAVPSTCTPSGSTLHLSARNIAFAPTVLCAPAGEPFTISFDNRDAGVPHNVQIFRHPDMTGSVFKGDLVSGVKTVPYAVAALPPGVYAFRCDVHPTQMFGTLIVSR